MYAKRAIALVFILVALGTVAVLMFAATPAAYGEWEGNWYWKDGGWIDYALNGVPDFDQKQPWILQPEPPWTYCGPVAAANSVWWFDSKFEPSPVGPIPIQPPPNPPFNDNYYLVASYAGFDDHDPQNAGGMGMPGLVDDLAWYFDTDGQRTGGFHQGTRVRDMSYGLQWFLYGDNQAYPQWFSPWLPRFGSYYDEYHVQMVKMPTWEWVVEEVERSEDVILLLGFWQEDPTGRWLRLGGHYVTVAGINAADLEIAFSDPFTDTAEAGAPGRVLDGLIFFPHQPQPGHPTFFHNDAGNISHDMYSVALFPLSPAGAWEILGYPFVPICPPEFWEQNVPQEYVGYEGCFEGAPVFVEVEYAIAMSPFYWKPGGEWIWQYDGDWSWAWWWYDDDGHSCLPDFEWVEPIAWYDGPTAVANSLWWFDSKAETLLTGGSPTPPPIQSDNYSLVRAYGGWDDHDPTNTAWFINDLVGFLNTNPSGTDIADMEIGIGAYMAFTGVIEDYYAKTQDAPPFEWVADEVETSEDVIILLGLYELLRTGDWERKGGHWVNAAGVGRENGLIGLSDPLLDNANVESTGTDLHLGRVFQPEQLGTPFTVMEKQDPQAISHDIYRAAPGAMDPGRWALLDYPVTDILTHPGYEDGMNGGGSAVIDLINNPFEAVMEWAIAVSPHSELVITKTADIVRVEPGQEVDIILEYANKGLAAVENVTITDLLDTDLLTSWSFTADPPISATEGITYEWTIPRLSYGQGGIITVAVQSDVTWCLSNTATITGENAIGGPTPDKDPSNNVSTIVGPEMTWDKLVYVEDELVSEPITIGRHDTITVVDRVWLTYTVGLTFTLVETWTDSLELTGWISDSGQVVTAPNVLTWEVANAAPDTWHTLTKTFYAKPGTWITDWITEVLDVECFECEQRVVTLEHPHYGFYLPIITKDYDAP